MSTNVFLLTATILMTAQVGPDWYKVRDFDAKGDGVTLDTPAVQRAIDTCAGNGGGTVYFGPGAWLCGSIHMKSNVTLWLDRAAVIKGSPKNEDYDPLEKPDYKNDADRETTYFHFALIRGEDVDNIAIVGDGVVDGNRERRGGPKNIAFKRCRHIDIKGVRVINCPNYPISLLGCDYVNIDGVTIQNGFADGVDPDCCRNVRISNCQIECYDDPIVPKASFALGERRSCENIAVTNCVLSTNCNALKLGTESGGDFKRIAFSNCVVTGRNGVPASGGIALESVDGSNIDGVVVSNITMKDVRVPIFIRLANRGRDMHTPVPGSLRNVCIDNVTAADASFPCSITGIPGHPVEGVTISNIRITYAGGIPITPEGEDVPELEKKYPDPDMFGMLPAYALYCRHVRDLSMARVRFGADPQFWRLLTPKESEVIWRTADGIPQPSKPDAPGIAAFFDDVTGLAIDDFRITPTAKAGVRFVKVKDGLLSACYIPDGPVYATVDGDKLKPQQKNKKK